MIDVIFILEPICSAMHGWHCDWASWSLRMPSSRHHLQEVIRQSVLWLCALTLICLSSIVQSQKTDIRFLTSFSTSQATNLCFFPDVPYFREPLSPPDHFPVQFVKTMTKHLHLYHDSWHCELHRGPDISRMRSAPVWFILLSVGVFELLVWWRPVRLDQRQRRRPALGDDARPVR